MSTTHAFVPFCEVIRGRSTLDIIKLPVPQDEESETLMSKTDEPGSDRSYSLAQIRAAIGGEQRHTDIWLTWLTSNGLGLDDHLTEDQAVAVAAGARFSAAKVPKAKITKLVRRLLGAPPEIHIDWVAVERPRVKDIEIEPGPFKGGPNKPKQRLPIVFDPYGVLERLREN